MWTIEAIKKSIKINPIMKGGEEMKKRGFTLVELLVVIAIIGLLSTLAFVSLNNARAKARDAKRVSDVRQLQSALELYYNNLTTPAYPTETDPVNVTTMAATLDVTIPTAPTPEDCDDTDWTDTGYMYESDDGASYQITFCLSGATGGLESGVRTATETGIQ